ncbi:hypothetical protein TELCIR_21641, partial [Teladorsagia circumcincta]
VVPRLIEVTRACRGRPSHREFFLRQLASLVAIIKVHAKPYMKQIFSLIADAWSEDHSVKVTVVSVLEQIGTAMGQEFAPHIAELIPYLLRVVQTDKSEERKLTAQMWKHFEVFRRSVDANLRKYNLNSGEMYEKYI